MDALISIAGSILGSLASKAAEYAVRPIAQQLSYLFKHESKFQNLRNKVGELNSERERVQERVTDAERNGEEIFYDVSSWLTMVIGKISEHDATKLQENEDKATKKCIAGFCPNFKSRYRLSKKAETETNAIADLINRGRRFDRFSYLPSPRLDLRPVKEYLAFQSRKGALMGVMEALKDDNCNIIGVHGMPGLGKTTLVKDVARKAEEEKLFDKVVFVAVTQTPEPEKIQKEIAEKLGLNFVEQSIDVRAARLSDRIKKGKLLIILDDIWVTPDLNELGIPSGDEHKGCKILMTSRELSVLESMDSRNFGIEILKEDEAWNLFKKIGGDIVERTDLKSKAKEVSQKCGGLPLAIATIANALKNKKHSFQWENALEELKRPKRSAVHSAIELSYNFLEEKELQWTFLLCSIMGHDAATEDLLKYCRGLGLFPGFNTTEKARNKVRTSVSRLQNSSLLLDGSTPERFDMHDVVRSVARVIASSDRHWLALGKDDEIQEWSDEEKMKNYSLISLQQCAGVNDLLSRELICPNLTFFSLSGQDSSLRIPDNFFVGMEKLKVLDFTKMHFPSLPSSMVSLENINTLCLSKCMLKDIGIIGELRNLEILNLQESEIVMLPREIGQLTRLKLLDLSDCRHLKVISPNVLASLTRLEELYLYRSFDSWVVEGIDDPGSNASLVELQHLSHLTTLELQISNEQAMPKDHLFPGKMKRYKISIGREWKAWENNWMKTSRMLKLHVNGSIHLYDRVKTLLRNTESLYLDGVKDAMNMLYEPTTEGLSQIKHLRVSNVAEIKFFISSMMWVSCLESLCLDKLVNLEAIFYGQPKAGSFDGLRVIKVDGCKMLKNLFCFSVARELRQLEEIRVADCENLTELIVQKRDEEVGDNEEIDILKYGQLRSLYLGGLESLTGLFYSEKSLSTSQQRRVQSNVTWLFDQKIMFPALEDLDIASLSNIEKLWHNDQVPVTSFGVQNLTSLSVWKCHKLKYVFTSSMVESFVQLKKLEVNDCNEMEEVIEGILGGEEEGFSGSITVFPKLHDMELAYLPNLKRFCCGIATIKFPVLRHLEVWSCPVLSTFHCDSTGVGNSSSIISTDHNFNNDVSTSQCLFNQKIMFPALGVLRIGSVSNIEKLWHDDQVPVASSGVQNLATLYVGGCHKLKYVLTSSMVESFAQLQALDVQGCDEMEEVIIGILRGEGEVFSGGITVFPKLRYVTLSNLRNLKRFCGGITTIKFPVLRYLCIGTCPVFSTFHCDSRGVGNNSSIISTDDNSDIDVPVSRCLFNQKVSFPVLQTLSLAGLDSLERLSSDRVAQVLFYKLIYFSLESCKLIEEIIEGEDDEVKQEVTFPLLEKLSLYQLPKLESFCSSGNYTFEFPSLKDVSVEACPNMKMFSQGDSNTPLLHKVRLEWSDKEAWPWAGNLNSTIQQLFKGREEEEEEEEDDDDEKPTQNKNIKENSEGQGNPSTSYTQNHIEEVRNFIKDEGNSSTSNVQ